MSEEVLIAIIAAAGLVIAAAVTVCIPLLVSIRKHSKGANEQVSNTHSTNLRHDLDGMATNLETVLAAVVPMQTSLSKLWSVVNPLSEAVEQLEQTIDPHHPPTPARSRWAAPIEGVDHEQHEQHGPVEGHQPEGDRRRRGRRRRDGGGSGG